MAHFVRQSKFRHVFGQPLKKEQCYDNVRITKSAWDGPFCAVNPKWLAVLSDANGSSSFYVVDLTNSGRLDVETPMVAGHKGQVLELQWCVSYFKSLFFCLPCFYLGVHMMMMLSHLQARTVWSNYGVFLPKD